MGHSGAERTHVVALLGRVPHLAPQVRVDGENEELDEEAPVEWRRFEIDCLRVVVDGVLSGHGIPWSGGR